MDDFDPHPSSEVPRRPVKGRGASGNVAHRFSVETRRAEDDGWEPVAPSNPRTRLLVDRAKSIISRNDSPDIGFDQSLNPYRGCEHGCIYCWTKPLRGGVACCGATNYPAPSSPQCRGV
jgi:hypothetical protein